MVTTQQTLVNDIAPRRNTRTVMLGWGLLRVPLALVILYLLRNPILTLIEVTIDYNEITEYGIAVISTPLSRLIIFAIFGLLLVAFWLLFARLFRPVLAYILTLIGAGVMLLITFRLTGTRLTFALPVLVILATNLIPDQLINTNKASVQWWNRFMAVGVGIAELLFFRRYVNWLLSLRNGSALLNRSVVSRTSIVLSIGLVSVLTVALLDYDRLIALEQSLRMPSEVTIFDSGDFNWIELDESGRYLFVTGHGLANLRRYDLEQPDAPPLETDVPTGEAQGFAYDPQANEIYVYNHDSQMLQYFDASTLEIKRSISLPEVSPGDPWITVDSRTDTLTIVSEADTQIGTPFLVLNRTTGEILDQRDLDAGNVVTRPDKSTIYLSFFRRMTSLLAYDLQQQVVLDEVLTDSRVDRMAYWGAANEILLTSPTESRVTRFDADTLENKGEMTTVFGVRVLAIDPTRNFLVCGSLTTGTVAVFDLATGEQRGSFYLGPWLRTIALDHTNGIAYVSANGLLYRLNYGHLS